MKSKKGAIELSMTTIIIIVIGITLLTLGLTWIRGVFRDLDDVTVGAFEQADAAIGELGTIDSELTISPDSIKVKQGGAKTVDVVIANFEDSSVAFQASVSSSSEKVLCVFADKKSSVSKEYNLGSGQQAEIKLIVDEKGGPLGLETCVVEVSGITGDNTEELIVEVVKN